MIKTLKDTREQTNNYINSVISINRKYGVEEMSQESIAKVNQMLKKHLEDFKDYWHIVIK